MLADLGPEEVAHARRKGVLVYADDQDDEAGFFPEKLVGRSGRGDACLAAYVARRLTATPAESAAWAAAAASLKMEAEGPFLATSTRSRARSATGMAGSDAVAAMAGRGRAGARRSQRVRLAVVDIDGCLTPGEAQAWNWKALQAISDLNQRARRGEEVPAVTVCTGRQEPYAEVLMQAIGAYLPGIYENGCGLYFPESYRFVEHPSITEDVKEALAAAKATLRCQVVASGLGTFQPGKEASLTLYPLSGVSVSGLCRMVARALASTKDLTVQASVSCVDVTPTGLDKGVGVRWLSEETGIPLAQMGGIGDSTSDLKYLRLVGRSAAPANATDEVKGAVGYVSAQEDGAGVVDILQHWCDPGCEAETGMNRPQNLASDGPFHGLSTT